MDEPLDRIFRFLSGQDGVAGVDHYLSFVSLRIAAPEYGVFESNNS